MLFETGKMTKETFPCEILYRIEGGCMAELYLARLQNTMHLVVVKAVRSHTKEADILEKEAELLKQLWHPQLPHMYAYIQEAEKQYYIMSYHNGITLEQYIKQYGKMQEKTVQETALGLCTVLDYLHSREVPVVHRDIKPSNIVLDETGTVILLDFGTAEKLTGQAEKNVDHISGTLGYIAPECWHTVYPQAIQSDIFSFGATLYYLLEARSPKECYGNFVLTDENLQKKNSWQAVLDKCCALKKEKRYESTAQVYKALCQLQL